MNEFVKGMAITMVGGICGGIFAHLLNADTHLGIIAGSLWKLADILNLPCEKGASARL
jgi:hypothetical protein